MSEGLETIKRKLLSLGVEEVDAKIESIIEILGKAKKDPTIWNLADKDDGRLHCTATHGNGIQLKLIIHVAPRRGIERKELAKP